GAGGDDVNVMTCISLISKVCIASGAGRKLVFPVWSAATWQVPILIRLTVLPATKQMLGVRELKTIGLPDPPPDAVTVYDWPTSAGSGGRDVKLISCGWGSMP